MKDMFIMYTLEICIYRMLLKDYNYQLLSYQEHHEDNIIVTIT